MARPTNVRRTTAAVVGLICAVAIALSAGVYLNMIGTIEEDAKAAFKGQFSPGIAYFQSFLQSNAAGLRGMADAISAMPTFPNHDAFQRVSDSCMIYVIYLLQGSSVDLWPDAEGNARGVRVEL